MFIRTWYRKLQRHWTKLHKMPGKLPGKVYWETAQLGAEFGEAAAKHQLETGFLGQSGSFGGGPYTPEGIEREMQYMRYSRQF